jgi:hypothetical protein
LAQAVDENQRDTRADTAAGEVLNKLYAKIPGLRQMLDVRNDGYGNPQSKPDSIGTRILNEFILPGRVNQNKQTDVSAAMKDLHEKTGERTAPDRKAPNSITANGETYKLTTEEKKEWERVYGKRYEEAIGDILDANGWDELTNEQRADVVSAANTRAKAAAKAAVIGGEVKTDEVDDLENPAEYLTAKEAIASAISDRNYTKLDKLLGEGGLYESQADDSKELLGKIGNLKKLVSMRGDGVSAENAMKAIDAVKGLDTQAEKTTAIVGLDGMSDADKIKALKACTSEDYAEKVQAAYDSGVSLEEWSLVYAAQQRIKNGEGSAQNKATDFAAWLDKNANLTAAKKDVVQEQLSFYSMNKAEPKHYDGLRESRVDEDTARRIANAMTKIQPPEGKTQATQEQKVDTILSMGLSDGDAWAALKEYTSEAWYNRAAESYRRGVDLDDYVRQFREADLPNDKGETNGQLSQDELWKYYKANPNNETFVKVMWLIGGFKTDWDTYKRKHR